MCVGEIASNRRLTMETIVPGGTCIRGIRVAAV